MERINDKKTIGEKFGNKNLMTKKPPSSTKYKDVSKTIDTGKTINDVQILSDSFVTKRRTELFKRIKASTVVKLLEENNNQESIYNLADEGKEENIYSMLMDGLKINDKVSTRAENESVYSYKTDKTDMTQKTSVTAVTYATEMLGDLAKLSYIMLDLREKSDYDTYHIKEAVSFPAPNISRDKFTAEIISLKNKPDKLIIVYHCDERNSVPTASLLIQKGFDNIYLLTGGIEEFIKSYPEKCEGPAVQQLINAKLQEEILKKDAALKSTKSKLGGTNTKSIRPSSQENKNNQTKNNISSKASMVSGSVVSKISGTTTNRQTISNLKKNLQK